MQHARGTLRKIFADKVCGQAGEDAPLLAWPVVCGAAVAEKTKALLADAIIGGALGRPIPNTPRNERKIAGALLTFWSQMHGLTLLLVDRLVGPSAKTDELSESVLQSMLDGLATRIPVLPPGTWVGPRESPK